MKTSWQKILRLGTRFDSKSEPTNKVQLILSWYRSLYQLRISRLNSTRNVFESELSQQIPTHGPHGPQPPRGAVPFGQRSAAVCTEVPWHLGLSWKIHHDFETLEVELIRIISISMIRYMSIRILNKCSCWDVLGSKFKTYGGRMGMSWRHLFNLFRMWWEYHEISSNDGIIGVSSRKVGVPKGMKFKKNTERVSTWRILGLCGNYMKLQYQTHKMDGSILQKISRNTRPLPIEGLQTGTWTYSPTTWVCPQMGTMIDNDCVHRRVLSVFLA